ncbi:peptidase U32 family protein [Sulfurisphaera tokodaii]|uniref:Peptidase U32 family protein n=2 Tax=Sulfurisphaera tokodaii TaxID=111955 RepID=Q970Q2_SULTO|nr:peptidase U32 family protein [Sulfurisphaera tokodaii]BAB66621.1 putative peptidase U32 family protein [Sulfurisphaera tokodaii str. 7]HII73559.1 U32 family peptidase [Sulfurisphaera tokodaii]
MRLVVATNFDNDLIEKISKYPVKYIYGSQTETLTGHGRASFILPKVNDEKLKEHISVAHSYKIKFLYTMNTANLHGKEYDEHFLNKLKNEIEKLINFGVDGFIVALPFLIYFIRKEHPDIEVSVSSFARITNIRKVEEYLQMGANTVIMDEDTNRNFTLLEASAKLAKKYNADIEVITNNTCLWSCPYKLIHDQVTSYLSAKDGVKNVWFEYPVLFCATEVRNDFANIIRMRWIRPEDLHYYEEIGIDRFKIAGRNKKTDWLVNVVKAYSEREYKGNLLDILSYVQGRATTSALRRINESSNYEILMKVYVDNAQFPPNWLSYFKYNRCEERSCEECRYCDIIAEKVIKIDGKPFFQQQEKFKPQIELIPRFVSHGEDNR